MPVAVLGEKSTVLVVLVPTSRGELEDLVRVVAARFGLLWRHQGRQNNRLASLHRDESVSGSCSVNALLRAASTYLPLDGPRVDQRDGRHRKKISSVLQDTLVWACLYQASWQEAPTRLAAPAAGAREHRRQNIAKSQL